MKEGDLKQVITNNKSTEKSNPFPQILLRQVKRGKLNYINQYRHKWNDSQI